MIKIDIKPLSTNKAWQGKRFKTDDYLCYERDLMYLLPKKLDVLGKLQITIVFAFSSKASDIDNCIKSFLDVLQKKYSFDDKMIYRMTVEKEIVKKGSEFISFEIKPWTS